MRVICFKCRFHTTNSFRGWNLRNPAKIPIPACWKAMPYHINLVDGMDPRSTQPDELQSLICDIYCVYQFSHRLPYDHRARYTLTAGLMHPCIFVPYTYHWHNWLGISNFLKRYDSHLTLIVSIVSSQFRNKYTRMSTLIRLVQSRFIWMALLEKLWIKNCLQRSSRTAQ